MTDADRCPVTDCYCGRGPETCAGCGVVTADPWCHPEVPSVSVCEACADAYYAEVGY